MDDPHSHAYTESEMGPTGFCNCGHLSTCHRMCGYSNCFRTAVGQRGFMPVCQVHKDDPCKWPEGRFTGSTFIKEAEASP